MVNATSIVGRFDGTVSYKDNSWGSFHCQIETFDLTNDILWSIEENFSSENLQRIYNDAQRKQDVVDTFEALPYVESMVWSDTGKDDKEINDVVLHLYFVLTFDNGMSYPVSVTHERGEVRFHTSIAEFKEFANKVQINEKIVEMLNKIMDSVSVS